MNTEASIKGTVTFKQFKTQVKVVNTSCNQLPEYAHVGDAGCDVRAFLPDCNDKFMYGGARVEENKDGTLKLILPPGSRALIPSGIHMSVPYGYEVQVRPRSGLALKHGITLLNSPGTIDMQYTGDVGVIMINTSDKEFVVEDGERVGQFVLSSVSFIDWCEVSSLEETDRGDGGFGHTGVK